MTIEFKLPELGENIESGDVVAVHVSPGDTVAKDQTIFELETDKAVLEIPSPAAGKVVELRASVGDEIKVGQVVMILDDSQGHQPADDPDPEPEPAPEPAPEPEQNETAESEPAPEPEEEPAPTPAPEQLQAPDPQPAASPPAAPSPGYGGTVPAGPAARRLAREIGVDIASVRGSGPNGRITEADVKAAARSRQAPAPQPGASAPAASQSTPAAPAAPVASDDPYAQWGDVRRESMSRVRRSTASAMAQAWADIPHVTHYDEADITDLERQRKALAQEVADAGGKLTMTAILLKTAALALNEFPKMKASIDVDNNELVYKDYVHIGVAVDTERGLLVPVIRNVDEKDIVEIAVELNQLAAAARTGKVEIAQMRGACFTITNLGGIGGTNFSPLINPPEVAILGVSRGVMKPVYQDGSFTPRLMMPFSLSYDHRVIDGADAARFCRWMAVTLENPLRLLIRDSDTHF